MTNTKLLRPRRVLVVDDEASFTRMLKLNLEKTSDYEVEVVNESSEVREAARAFNPDIILLDIVMPGPDGGDVAQEIRRDDLVKHIPIIFVSAMVSRKESASGLYHSGGEYFLAKPVTTEGVIDAIEKLVALESA